MEISEPRLRSLLRQAERVARAGKLAAAESLYRQITEEAPDAPEGWLGLAQVSRDRNVKIDAYERALSLDGDNEEAQAALAALRDGSAAAETAAPPAPEGAPDKQTATVVAPPTPRSAPAHLHREVKPATEAAGEETLVCYRHPNRSTSLRCYKCNRPICSECTVKTPVGYLCPNCQREAEDLFYNAKPLDNLLALIVALPLSIIAGYLVTRFGGGGFFVIIILFFISGGIGTLIGRGVKRVIGKRRGRYIPYITAGSVIFGVAIFVLPILLVAGLSSIFALLGPGVYLFVATPAAFYWSR